MKKYPIITFIVIILVGIQLIQPARNHAIVPTVNEFVKEMEAPLEVVEILRTSCYDCHSNQTNYPWYSNIAPMSWIIASHVNKGKEHLNFSEWQHYNSHQKEHVLEAVEEVISNRRMPLKSYLLLHEKGQLNHQEQQYLLEWITLAQYKMK